MKFGLIGVGLIGRKRIESLLELGHEVIGIYDSNQSTLREVSKIYNLRGYTSEENLFKEKPDCIMVCTTHNALYDMAKKVLSSGINLFLEKPGVSNLDQARDLYQIALSKELRVGIGFNHRFHPAISLAKQITDQNKLGRILYLRASYGHGGRPGMEKEWRCDKQKSGGGELIDQGSHLIDLSRFFLGELKCEYSYINTYFWDTDVEDNVFLALSNEQEALCWLHASWTEWKNKFSFEIFCEKGKLYITGLGRSYGEEKLIVYKMKPELGPPDIEEFYFPEEDSSWRDEIIAFTESLKGGDAKVVSLEDLIKLHEIIDDIYNKNLISVN